MATNGDWALFARLADDLSDLPAADYSEGIDLLLDHGCRLLRASDALLAFGVRSNGDAADPLNGWRAASTSYRFGPHRDRDEKVLSGWYSHFADSAIDPTTVHLARTAGNSRAFLHYQILSEGDWSQTPIADLFDTCGIRDRLSGGLPLGRDVEILLVAYRRGGQRRFAERDSDVMRAVMAVAKPFVRRVALAHGFFSQAILTPRERQVLRLLLMGHSEKETADVLGLRERSLHHHVSALHKKLRVRSRAELMALFLNPAGSNKPS